MGDDGGTAGTAAATGGGYTKRDLDNAAAAARREAEARFADYADLKAKAAEADKTKSDVDKLTDAVRQLTERAEKAERDTMRRDVADRFKLPKTFAAKLAGTTRDDLEREAREIVDELKTLGVKFDGDGSDGKGDAGKNGGDGKAGDGKAGENGGDAGKDGKSGEKLGGGTGDGDTATKPLGGSRPQETLRSGAVPSGGEAVDYGKAAESILGNRMF